MNQKGEKNIKINNQTPPLYLVASLTPPPKKKKILGKFETVETQKIQLSSHSEKPRSLVTSTPSEFNIDTIGTQNTSKNHTNHHFLGV